MARYVGRHSAALGLLITAGCSCLFVAVSLGVQIRGPLVRFDRSTADALHSFASEASGLTDSLRIVGVLGSLEALAVVSMLVVGVLLLQRRWSMLAAWLVAVLGGEALNLLLKNVFARPRPHFDRPLVVETSYSYPSGQAMESVVIYGMLAYFAVLSLSGQRTHAIFVVGAAALVILIGFSRVYLGAHYFSDVVGGFVAGGAWLSTVITGWGTIRRRNVASGNGQTSST
ncbi:MAG TPA: phosphatase PAP2 family protein [Rubrobacteraceae bacterium]|nr:phosphatase PAP2 family protein [Rubrobacteraceae bacterium]